MDDLRSGCTPNWLILVRMKIKAVGPAVIGCFITDMSKRAWKHYVRLKGMSEVSFPASGVQAHTHHGGQDNPVRLWPDYGAPQY